MNYQNEAGLHASRGQLRGHQHELRHMAEGTKELKNKPTNYLKSRKTTSEQSLPSIILNTE